MTDKEEISKPMPLISSYFDERTRLRQDKDGFWHAEYVWLGSPPIITKSKEELLRYLIENMMTEWLGCSGYSDWQYVIKDYLRTALEIYAHEFAD